MVKILRILLAAPVVLALLYVLSTRGRRNHPGWEKLRGWAYAHRGLYDATKPENSMAAFRAALENGYGIELDVHLLSDGELAVMHDSALLRTTGQAGRMEDLTVDELKNYRLEGTEESIPTLRQVLELFRGKAPLIVELKPVDGNHARLAETACDLLESYPGPYCIESFDPRCIYWLKKHRPQVIRGQLTENFLKGKHPVPWILRFIVTHQMVNFLTRPDFVAYQFHDRKTVSNVLARKLWGMQGVAWTLKTPEEQRIATEEGWIPIFEAYKP